MIGKLLEYLGDRLEDLAPKIDFTDTDISKKERKVPRQPRQNWIAKLEVSI